MANEWIPVKVHLKDEPEILKISEKTGRSRHEVVGLLVDFWGWVSEVSTNGKITSAFCPQPVRILSAVVGGDENFWSAVVESGWLKIDDGILVPRFDRWLSKSGKRRLKDLQRKKLNRNFDSEKTSAKRPQKFHKKKDVLRTTEQNITSITPPTPSKGGVCVDGNNGAETDRAWLIACQTIKKHDPKIRNPHAYIAELQKRFSTPAEAGLFWVDGEIEQADRHELVQTIKKHDGETFVGKDDTWVIYPDRLKGLARGEQLYSFVSIVTLRKIAGMLKAQEGQGKGPAAQEQASGGST